MSGRTRSTIGSVLSFVGTIVSYVGGIYSWVGWILVAAGAALSYDGQKRQQREAELRARQSSRSASIKGNVRSSHEHHLMVCGEARVGGTVVLVGTKDGPDLPNQYLYIGIAHSIAHAGGCEGITDFWIDDTKVTAAQLSGDPNTAFVDVNAGDLNGLVSIRHFRGTSTQTPDSGLVSDGIEASTNYRRGTAYTIVRLKRTTDDELFRRAFKYGIPILTVSLKGIRAYDPRLDSTNGGAGSHRYADPLTWAYTDNAILLAATYSILGKSDGGFGRPATGIDWPSVASAASVCDETKAIPGPATRARFPAGGVLNTADKREVNLQKLLDASMGKKVTIGGKWKFYAASYRTPVIAIDQTWLAGPIKIITRSPIEAIYNAVRVTFDDASQDFKTVDAPPSTSSTYETQDGGQRVWQDLTLPMVSNSYDAQYLAQIQHKRSRYQMIVSLVLNLKALDIETWETVTLSLPDIGSPANTVLAGKVFRVVDLRPGRNGIEVTLQEDNSAIYTVETMQVPNTGSAPSPGSETPPAMTGLAAQATADGIVLTFNNPPIYLSSRVQIERASSSGGSFSVIGSVAAGTTVYVDREVAGGTWYYKVRARTRTGTLGAYSSEVSATAKMAADTGGITVLNAGFEGGDRDWTEDASGWVVTNDAGNARSGTWVAKITGTGSSVTKNSTNDRMVPVTPGTIVDAYAFLKSSATANGTARVRIRWLDSAFAELSTTDGTAIIGSSTPYTQSRAIAAAPANAFFAQLQFRVASFSSASPQAWYADDALMIVTPKEPYNLTVAGSGQTLGDQRNEVLLMGLNRQPAVATTSPLSSSDAGSTATISVASHTVQGGFGTISYNSGSITGLAFGTDYYVYADDPTYAGGAVTYVATTTPSTVTANSGRYFVGSILTVNDGGGGGGPGGGCVWEQCWLSKFTQARDAKPKDTLHVMDDDGCFYESCVESVDGITMQPCIEIEMTGGAKLTCSESTPFTLEHLASLWATDLRVGMKLATRYGGLIAWEPIKAISRVGDKPVVHIHAFGMSYAAGHSPDALVISHNPQKP